MLIFLVKTGTGCASESRRKVANGSFVRGKISPIALAPMMRLYGQPSRRSVHRGKSGLCIELPNHFFEVADHVLSRGREHECRTSMASPMSAPQSPRPHARTYGNFPRGNGEIPETSLSLERDVSGKGRCHHPDMHVTGKSDSLEVPVPVSPRSQTM